MVKGGDSLNWLVAIISTGCHRLLSDPRQGASQPSLCYLTQHVNSRKGSLQVLSHSVNLGKFMLKLDARISTLFHG